jgi:hypothetical protein
MWRDDWAYGDLAMPIRGRWDAPPPAQNGTYSISVELVAVSQYADGTVRTYSFTGQIGIDVGFAAEADIGSGS